MKKETVNRMLEQVDDDLLQESIAPAKKSAHRWTGTAVAAALALVLGAGIGLNAWLRILPMDGGANGGSEAYIGALEGATETTTGTIAGGATESDDAMTGTYWVPEGYVPLVGDYEANCSIAETPEVGEVIIFPGLQQAMQDHEGLDVLYVVDMDVFFAEDCVTGDALQQEADALTEEGYTVVEVKRPEGWLVLHMTAEEIQNFTAVRYGYGLRSGNLPFESEIGGSATSETPDIAIEDEVQTGIPVVYGSTLPECNCGEDTVQPANGEVKIDHKLLHGMELHEGTEARFFVAAELYKDGELLTGEEALYPLIVKMKESYWNTCYLGGPEEISFLAEATAEQIESFEAPEGYAVVLRFAREHEENDGVVASFWWE